ncbi:MAG: hypothetical protein WGN25_02230 [Candidatus Electrothrix sp. GW3-4]|uniref:hypothetical protein n=1 Tax=Candidatus Electrothrix sp. GW3-4 TaxID=3126740 RepID=UPI0030D597E3
MFSEKKFVECVSEFETDFDWQYSGESDLLLFQAFASERRTEIDFTSAIASTIEHLQRAAAFQSVHSYLEDLIRTAKPIHNYCNNANLTRMSDKEGWRYGSRALADWVINLLPAKAPAKKLFNVINELRIKDISRK